MSSTFPKIATLFSGGGLVEAGAIAAGYEPIWGVEFSPEIAEVHRANVPGRMLVRRVQEVDPMTLDRPDLLHASPPCTTASVANSNGGETQEDREMGEAVCRFLRVLTPPAFTLENVSGYRKFESYQRILCTLDELGYWTHSEILNSADFGVPQTRKRLILRAVRDGFPPPLPPKQKWIGWYAAIEDLLPTLPESKFAEWQLARLPQELTSLLMQAGNPNCNRKNKFKRTREPADTVVSTPMTYRAFLACVAGENSDIRAGGEPSPTLTNAHGAGKYRAFIVEGTSSSQDYGLSIREAEEPMYTLKASEGRPCRHRAFLVEGDAAGDRCPTVLLPDDPAMTIKTPGGGRVHRAFLVDGKPANYEGDLQIVECDRRAVTLTSSQEKHPFRAWLEQGRVVAMTPRALARFQSMPDSYRLPDKNSLAVRVIGNGVPCRLYEAIARGLRETL